MATAMSNAITVDAKKLPELNNRGSLSVRQLDNLQKTSGINKPFGTSPLKSKKVFVE